MSHATHAAFQSSPSARHTDIAMTVADIIADVRERGDEAVRNYSEKFDGWSPKSFRL